MKSIFQTYAEISGPATQRAISDSTANQNEDKRYSRLY